MDIYIGYRDLAYYNSRMNVCGGTPENPDHRLYTVKDDIYLLIFCGQNYAVTKERAERFAEEVMSKSTGSHPGHFPLMITEVNGKNTAAVIEIKDDKGTICYDFDDELLLKMLTELKDECGNPLDKRGLINYCYPNPALPDDFELKTICHQIYCAPDNTPASVVRTYFPDTETSHFWILNDKAHVIIREGTNENEYSVPDDLIPEIKEKVKELCREPAEAYVDPGNWEGYIQFGKTKERIFTDPDKTLELLKYIASGSVFESTKEIDTKKFYPYHAGPGFGLGMMGFMNAMPLNQAPNTNANPPAQQTSGPSVPGSWDCAACGKKGNLAKFCPECGSEKPEGWKCPSCGAVNSGRFCSDCGSPRQ